MKQQYGRNNNGKLEIVTWDVNIDTVLKAVQTAHSCHVTGPEEAALRKWLTDDVAMMSQTYPNWYACVGQKYDGPNKTEEGTPYVFSNEVKCVVTDSIYPHIEPADYIVWAGHLPLPLDGRPTLEWMRSDARTNYHKKRLGQYLVQVRSKSFLRVPIHMTYSGHPMRTQSKFHLHKDVWEMFNAPVDHTDGYGGVGNKVRQLCLYPSSRKGVHTSEMIAQRVVPYLSISLLLADVRSAGRYDTLETWLSRHNANVHTLFNNIGKSDKKSKKMMEELHEFYTKEVLRGNA